MTFELPDDPRQEDQLEELIRADADTDLEELVRGNDDVRALRDPEERPLLDPDDPDEA